MGSVLNCFPMCCSSCGLQVEQETANNRHQAEVFELKHQLSCFNSLVEKGNQALQQKAQVRNTVLKPNKQNSEYRRKIGNILF